MHNEHINLERLCNSHTGSQVLFDMKRLLSLGQSLHQSQVDKMGRVCPALIHSQSICSCPLSGGICYIRNDPSNLAALIFPYRHTEPGTQLTSREMGPPGCSSGLTPWSISSVRQGIGALCVHSTQHRGMLSLESSHQVCTCPGVWNSSLE